MVRFWLCFKYKPTGFADGSDVGGGGKREIKGNTRFWPKPQEKTGLPLPERGQQGGRSTEPL